VGLDVVVADGRIWHELKASPPRPPASNPYGRRAEWPTVGTLPSRLGSCPRGSAIQHLGTTAALIHLSADPIGVYSGSALLSDTVGPRAGGNRPHQALNAKSVRFQ